MASDDLKRILMGPRLFRLDTIISPRLVPLLYLCGLGGLLLWAVDHLFATFALNFGSGLWGLLEIVVYGGLGFILLRVLCELLMIFFKSNEETAEILNQTRLSSSLLEEVRDAIHEIADEEEDDEDVIAPATVPVPGDVSNIPPRGPRRTARRTPRI